MSVNNNQKFKIHTIARETIALLRRHGGGPRLVYFSVKYGPGVRLSTTHPESAQASYILECAHSKLIGVYDANVSVIELARDILNARHEAY